MSDHQFEPFEYDPAVCLHCGGLGVDHPEYQQTADTPPYREAMWRVILKYGARERDVYYGGGANYMGDSARPGRALAEFRDARTKEEAEHVLACGILWVKTHKAAYNVPATSIPDWGSYQEFAGTFADGNNDRPAITGYVTCKCEQVYQSSWALTDLTVGQLIWHALKEGDE